MHRHGFSSDDSRRNTSLPTLGHKHISFTLFQMELPSLLSTFLASSIVIVINTIIKGGGIAAAAAAAAAA